MEKLLVANRGEIALRIFRACRLEGVATVAVYAPDDRGSLHARSAGEAVEIASYLDAGEHVRAAREAGADAVHPGYGFLAESAELAEAVLAAGLTWIGPPPSALRAGGDKLASKETARAAGVPVLPTGSPEEIGFPLLVKAAAGGGGRGMRVVRAATELDDAVAAATREAAAAFGDDTVFFERYLERPRHVEIQLLADRHGTVVALGERDCSVQRRHQKVLEEGPSPAVAPDLRTRMGAAAVAAARALGYTNVGTVEFLLSPEGTFYFLEMNTRLQVEHPVTELITGVDLVRWQLAVAEGGALPMTQDQIPRRGAAIECRVYAEDAVKFLPSPGTITSLRVPAGPGIRDDSGVVAGSVISVHYDPMISKLCAYGATRAEAIDRMRRALMEYRVGGIRTNLAFHRRVMRHPAFLAGDYDTGFIERHKAELTPPAMDEASQAFAAIGAALAAREAAPAAAQALDTSAVQPSAWRRATNFPNG